MRQLPYSGQDASISPMAASSFIFTIWPCLSRGILPLCPIKLLPEEGMRGWIQSNRGIKFELRSNYLFCMDKLRPRRSPLPLNKLQVWEQKKCPVLQGYFCLDLTLQKTTYIDIRVYLQSKPWKVTDSHSLWRIWIFQLNNIHALDLRPRFHISGIKWAPFSKRH